MPFVKTTIYTIKPGSPSKEEFINNLDLALLTSKFPEIASKTREELVIAEHESYPYHNQQAPGFISLTGTTSEDGLVSTWESKWETRDAYVAACEEKGYVSSTEDSVTTDFLPASEESGIFNYVRSLYAHEYLARQEVTFSEV